MNKKIYKLVFCFSIIMLTLCNIDCVKAAENSVSFEQFHSKIKDFASSSSFSDIINVHDVSDIIRVTINDIVPNSGSEYTSSFSVYVIEQILVGEYYQHYPQYSGTFYYDETSNNISLVTGSSGDNQTIKEKISLRLLEYSIKSMIQLQNLNMNYYSDYLNSLLESRSTYTLEKDGIEVSQQVSEGNIFFKINLSDGLKTYHRDVVPTSTPSPSPTPSSTPDITETPSQTPVATDLNQEITPPTDTTPENPNTGIYFCASLLLIVAVFSGIFYSLMFKKSKFPQV